MPHLGRIEARRPGRTRAHQPAKSGSSVDMKSAKAARRSSLAFGIEHERDEPRERIVLDHDDGKARHGGRLQLFFGSRSTLSAVNTRLCIR